MIFYEEGNFFITLAIILIIIDVFLIFGDKKEKTKSKTNTNNNTFIKIIKYKFGKDEKIKEIKITDENDIKKLNELRKKLKPLSSKEEVDLALAKEIEIVYDDDIIVSINLSEKDYCYYINKGEDISSLSHMPNGMYEFISEKIE